MDITNLSEALDKIIDYRGKTPKKLGGKWSNEGYRALSALNVKSSGLEKLDQIKFVDSTLYKKWMTDEVRRGDILLTSEAPAGQVYYWDSNEKIVLSQRLFALRVNEKFDAKYLSYYLKSSTGQKAILDKISGSTVSGISAKMFDYIPVIKPELPVQKSIGNVLSVLDSKIEVNNKINAELEAMANLVYNYWFIQFDFPDKEGNPYKSSGGKMVWHEELKREIPQGWDVKELGEEIEVQRGLSYTSNEIKDRGIPMINLNSFNLNGTYKHDGVKPYSGKYTTKNIANPGDLLIAATDVTRNADIIGKAILVPDYYDDDLVFSMDIAKIMSINIPASFLMQLFNSKHYHNYIKWYATGTLVLHLNLDGVKRYKTEIPPVSLLERFDTLYTEIGNRIYKTAEENQKIAELRDWLLPLLMNGQVTIRN